ncbi:MAG: hypothetical protein GY937_26525 [bacterium]|nr:hypothetical protein [bacterium]
MVAVDLVPLPLSLSSAGPGTQPRIAVKDTSPGCNQTLVPQQVFPATFSLPCSGLDVTFSIEGNALFADFSQPFPGTSEVAVIIEWLLFQVPEHDAASVPLIYGTEGGPQFAPPYPPQNASVFTFGTLGGLTNVGDLPSSSMGIASDDVLIQLRADIRRPATASRILLLDVNAAVPSTPPTPPTECSDGIDNDGDDLIDFGQDPGCRSPDQISEKSPGR